LYRAVLPFIGVLFVTLMVVSYIPIITTFLPDKVKSHEINDNEGGSDMGGGEPLNDDDFGMTADDLEDLNKDGGAGEVDAGPAEAVDAGPPAGAAADEPPLTGWAAKKAAMQKAAAEKKAAREQAAAEKKAAREEAAAAKKAAREESAAEKKSQ
jgi:hypothetical protein